MERPPNSPEEIGVENKLRLINYSGGALSLPATLLEHIRSSFAVVDLAPGRNLHSLITANTLNLILMRLCDFEDFAKTTLASAEIRCVLLCDGTPLPEALTDHPLIHDWFAETPAPEKLIFSMLRARNNYFSAVGLRELEENLLLNQKDLQELNRIGAALSAEHDIDKLLNMILIKIMEITSSDAGSLYLVTDKHRGTPGVADTLENKQLMFKMAKNYSVEAPFSEYTMNIDRKSISGTVVLTGKAWNIPDVYTLPEESGVSAPREFDKSIGYRTMSMLTLPMKTHEDEIIGVIQLINKKRKPKVKLTNHALTKRYVIPYNANDESLALSLAGQAAVALENARLYQNITHLFEGLIRASVIAIESRDPTTSGHSERVAALTLALAEAVHRSAEGPFAAVHYTEKNLRELRYATLLHDFGKIGVRENILIKANKLYPAQMEKIQDRFSYIRKCMELDYSRRKLELMRTYGESGSKSAMENLDVEMAEALARLGETLVFVQHCNEPFPLKPEDQERLASISQAFFQDGGNNRMDYLTSEELQRLSIKRGSLSEEERLQMEEHVTHSFKFLVKIPWTKELRNIPQIAFAHHERLDGSGYPRQLDGPEIPFEAQIMAITDFYDALTASDRPYKKAIPPEKALQIMGFEVKDGKLNKDLFDIFVSEKVYLKVN